MNISFYPNEPRRKATRLQVAVDLEWYDQTDGEHITEIGIAIQPHDRTTCKYFHYIISDHEHLKNTYAPTSKTGFVFGQSTYIDDDDIPAIMRRFFSGAGNNCPVDIIFHSGQNDVKALKKNGVNVPDSWKDHDTSILFRKRYEATTKWSLQYVCTQLRVSVKSGSYHNAGNDAAYALKIYNLLVALSTSTKLENLKVQESARVNRSSRASIDQSYVYATGGFKKVYMGEYEIGSRRGEKCVCKVFKKGGVLEESYFENELVVVNKALEIIDEFNAAGIANQNIMLNIPEIWTFTISRQKNLLEPFIKDFIKFNSNTGWVGEISSHWNQISQALSHFSFDLTKGKALICDIQGGIYSNVLGISDPVIMSPEQCYGPTDLGNPGISTFFANHKCNMFCQKSWLTPVQPKCYFAAVAGSSMVTPSNRQPEINPIRARRRIG